MSRHSDPRIVATTTTSSSILNDVRIDVSDPIDTLSSSSASLASSSTTNVYTLGPSERLVDAWKRCDAARALDEEARSLLRTIFLEELARGPQLAIQLIMIAPQDVVPCRRPEGVTSADSNDCPACMQREPRIESVEPASHVVPGSHAWHVQRWLRDEGLGSIVTLEKTTQMPPPQSETPNERFFLGHFRGRGGHQQQQQHAWVLSATRI
jgi:hypothetical protein